jgi:hypothetical protein
MTTDNDTFLIRAFLRRELLAGSVGERAAMKAVGRLLLDKEVSPETEHMSLREREQIELYVSATPPREAMVDWVCHMLGRLFLEGKLTIKLPKRKASEERALKMAMSVAVRFFAGGPGTWDSAVSAVVEDYKKKGFPASRATVARACKKHHIIIGDKEF